MRTVSGFILTAILAGTGVTAQPSFGFSAGINAANNSELNSDGGDLPGKVSRLGLTGGVFVDVFLVPSVSLHSEVNYSQKGYKLNIMIPEGSPIVPEGLDGELTYQLDYIEVPLSVAYHLPVGPNLAVSLAAGPYAALKVREHAVCTGDIERDCDTQDEGPDSYRRVDFGAAGGLVVSSGPLGVGARYTRGLTNIEIGSDEYPDRRAVRHRVFSVFARYGFGG